MALLDHCTLVQEFNLVFKEGGKKFCQEGRGEVRQGCIFFSDSPPQGHGPTKYFLSMTLYKIVHDNCV